jgi:hypothetical protein
VPVPEAAEEANDVGGHCLVKGGGLNVQVQLGLERSLEGRSVAGMTSKI